jgi:hypothetical protein
VRSIVIIGAGELGGALARQIAAADIASRVVLVDDAGKVAEGKALDIRQAAPVDGYTTEVGGSADESLAATADAIVIADRVATNDEWHGDAGVALVRRLRHLNPSALMICAGAKHLEIVSRSVREGGLDSRRLIGSAPEALRGAVVSLTSLEANCAPSEISLTVVGRPPAHTIVPWEDASIAGRRAAAVLSPPAVTRLDGRLARLWPPGPLTLASAAARFLRATSTRQLHTLCAFVVARIDESEHHRIGMLPVTMKYGQASVVSPTLTVRDKVRLDSALALSDAQ